MPTTTEIRQRRSRLLEEARAIQAKAEATIEERSRLDAIAGEVETLATEERTARILEEAERMVEPEIRGGRDTHGDLEARVRVGRALRDIAERGELTGAEAEYNAEHRSGRMGAITLPVSCFLGGESRAVTTTTPGGGPGSNLVPTSLGPMIDRLRPVLAIQGLGATVLSGLSGNLDLPRVKASGSAGWVAEHSAPSASDPQFEKISLSPKTVVAQYEVSRRMLIQATSLEAVIRQDIGWLLAAALDSAAIKGGGTNEPVGIIGNANVPVLALGTNGAAMTIDTTADMVGAVDIADGPTGRGFLTNNKVKKAAMKLKDTTGLPLGMSVVFQGEPATFSNQVPGDLTKGSGTNLSAIIYGAWSELILAYWSSVDIVMNPYADSVAGKGGALIHAFLDADIALRHPAAFIVCKDVVAA